MSMKVKVCGMKYPQNIRDLEGLHPDYMGFIFYPPSPRYVGEDTELKTFLPSISIKKVGVFVNAAYEEIIKIRTDFSLDIVQLHGKEPEALCRQLKQQGIPVIKAFSISSPADFIDTKEYVDVCDYFLFDTKTPHYGGSGLKFDWQILQAYTYHVPFFLSGGIALSDVEDIKKIAHPQLVAIDVNSRFETSPATKNINQLQQFIQEIKQLNTY